MPAFASLTFIPRIILQKRAIRCHSKPYSVPARKVQAVISNEPETNVGSNVESPIIPEYDAPTNEPYAFTLFDADLVLYNVAPGTWTALDDLRPYRLARLSEGYVVRDSRTGKAELECAYNGGLASSAAANI